MGVIRQLRQISFSKDDLLEGVNREIIPVLKQLIQYANVSPAGGVTSVFARSGAVTAAFADYVSSLIESDSPDVAGTTLNDVILALKTAAAAAAATAGTALTAAGAAATAAATAATAAAAAQTTANAHEARHLEDGADALATDKATIAHTAANYTPTVDAGKTTTVTQLGSHLNGIDAKLASIVPAVGFDVTAKGSPDSHWILGNTPTVDTVGGHTLSVAAGTLQLSYGIDKGVHPGSFAGNNVRLTSVATSTDFAPTGAYSFGAMVRGDLIPNSGVSTLVVGSGVSSSKLVWQLALQSGGVPGVSWNMQDAAGTNEAYTSPFIIEPWVVAWVWFTINAAHTLVTLGINNMVVGTHVPVKTIISGAAASANLLANVAGQFFEGHIYCASYWMSDQTANMAAISAAHGL